MWSFRLDRREGWEGFARPALSFVFRPSATMRPMQAKVLSETAGAGFIPA